MIVSLYNKVSEDLFFNTFIELILEGYLEFLIIGYLNYHSPIQSSESGETYANFLSYYIIYSALFVLPALLIWVATRSQQTLRSEEF